MIKLKANKIHQEFVNGQSVVTMIVDKGWLQSSLKINDIDYAVSVDIKKHHNSKSYQQVKYFFAVLSEVDKHYNVISTKETLNELYCNVIEQAQIKTDILSVKTSDIKGIKHTLSNIYRVIAEIDKNDDFTTLKCFRGLSQFDKQETNQLIEYLLYYANETIGYETDNIRMLKETK